MNPSHTALPYLSEALECLEVTIVGDIVMLNTLNGVLSDMYTKLYKELVNELGDAVTYSPIKTLNRRVCDNTSTAMHIRMGNVRDRVDDNTPLPGLPHDLFQLCSQKIVTGCVIRIHAPIHSNAYIRLYLSGVYDYVVS